MEGVVVRFRSDQGYGFIRPDNGAPELFVHVSEVLGGRPPEVGRRVSFVPVETPKGWQARSVVPGSRQRSPKVVATGVGVVVAALATAVGILAVGGPWWAWWLGAVNVVTPVFYWWDKRQARRQGFRVPEFTLLGLGAVGGTPSALVARPVLHHKTSKMSFRLKFWAISAVQVLAGLWWFVIR